MFLTTSSSHDPSTPGRPGCGYGIPRELCPSGTGTGAPTAPGELSQLLGKQSHPRPECVTRRWSYLCSGTRQPQRDIRAGDICAASSPIHIGMPSAKHTETSWC